MPRYHFGSANGHREPDPDGVMLNDDETAQAYAIRYAGEVLSSEPCALWRSGHWRVEVTDDAGALLFTVVTIAIDAPKRIDVFGNR